jgi:hypothetical protein
MMTPPFSICANPALTVKSEPLEWEIPFCAVAVVPWKDMVSLKVIAVVKAVYYAKD